MAELHLPWLELSILLPILGAIVVSFIKDPLSARRLCLVACGLTFACAAGEWLEERDFEQEGLRFELRGLDALQPLAGSEHSARKRGLAAMRRLTVVADVEDERWLEEKFVELGASGFTSMPCRGAGRHDLALGTPATHARVRIEVVMPHGMCERAVAFLRNEVLPDRHVTACVETVDVVRREQFDPLPDPTKPPIVEHA